MTISSSPSEDVAEADLVGEANVGGCIRNRCGEVGDCSGVRRTPGKNHLLTDYYYTRKNMKLKQLVSWHSSVLRKLYKENAGIVSFSLHSFSLATFLTEGQFD